MSSHDVTCPFCGLLCDDLVISNGAQLTVQTNGCPLSRSGFAAANVPAATPQLAGQPVTLEQAIAQAAQWLQGAAQPVIAGLATDVAGQRAALHLAERCGAVVDHLGSAALFGNLRAMQHGGWINTTLTEARNRADLIVIFGTETLARFPRLVERVIAPAERLFPEQAREVVLIGADPAPAELAGLPVTTIPLPVERVGDLVAALRAELHGVPPTLLHGLDAEMLKTLVATLLRADYAVLVWSAATLGAQAELTIEALIHLLRDLNHTTRAAGLALAGTQGDLTAHQVSAWHSGFSVRTGYARGVPEFDPVLYDSRRMLAAGEADVLLWVAGFTPDTVPPPTAIPTIVLGHPALTFTHPPAVFIPTGIPGIDHEGQLFRSDTVVAMPLMQLREQGLPSAAAVLNAIAVQLAQGGAA